MLVKRMSIEGWENSNRGCARIRSGWTKRQNQRSYKRTSTTTRKFASDTWSYFASFARVSVKMFRLFTQLPVQLTRA